MKDLYSNVLIQQALDPQVMTTAGGAKNSGDIDMQGFDSLTVATLVGDISETLSESVKITLKIEHADDDGTGAAGTYEACADADVIGYTLTSGVFKTIDGNTKEKQVYPIGYKGGRRFVKVTATPSAGLTNGGAVAIVACKGNASYAPVTQNN